MRPPVLPPGEMLKEFIQSEKFQAFTAGLAARYLAVVARTTRWHVEGGAHWAEFGSGTPCIVAFWHETLPAMPYFWLRSRGLRTGSVLASRHRDGQLIAGAVRYFGLEVVSGSSSRGGAAGLRALAAALKAGKHVGLTPDGPRGPRHEAAPGVVQLAALTGARILPCAASTGWAVRLNSWDGMRFPLPFGPGRLVCGEFIQVARDGWQEALPVVTMALNQALDLAQGGRR